jgi:hypothetical protein
MGWQWMCLSTWMEVPLYQVDVPLYMYSLVDVPL